MIQDPTVNQHKHFSSSLASEYIIIINILKLNTNTAYS